MGGIGECLRRCRCEYNGCNEISTCQLCVITTIMVMHFPFTFCNLYFALSSEPSDCMDKGYGFFETTLRNSLLGIAITSIVQFVILLGLVMLFKVKKIT